MNSSVRCGAASAALVVVAVLASPPVALANNASLYSQEAVQALCVAAQKVVSSTDIEAYSVNHTSTQSITFSSAAPYEGPNLSAYNGKETPGDALPLTVQSFISYSTVPATGWRYPETVSCKMKDAEAIRFHFGDNAAGAQQTCRTMNEQIVAGVFAKLTSWQRRTLRYREQDIVFEDDVPKPSGPDWINPLFSPFTPTTIYLGIDGLLHIKSRASILERTNPTNDAGPDKKGSYYCHLPTPEHVLATLRGQVAPCSMDMDFCIR
jgi:hypothetical protein